MMIPSLQAAATAFVVGMVLSVPLTWYLTAEYKDAKWTSATETQKVEAAKTLQTETEKVILAERKTNKLKDQLEIQHAKSLEQVNAILADNKRLAARLGGLRDPGRRPSCNSTLPTAAKPTGGSSATPAQGGLPEQAAGFLSPDASEFLINFAAEADRAAVYAQTCHEWAVKVIGQ